VVCYRHYLKEHASGPKSKNELEDFNEYNPVDKKGDSLETFLNFLGL
jgi:hypothetical protein